MKGGNESTGVNAAAFRQATGSNPQTGIADRLC